MTVARTGRAAYIRALRLRVTDLDASLRFYHERLGMTRAAARREGPRLIQGLRFPTASDLAQDGRPATRLELIHEGRPGSRAHVEPDRWDLYWKIGVTLADVDRARDRLRAAGVEVSSPAQFLDIGYLCHLRDPDGLGVELLQHAFQRNFTATPGLDAHPLGERPTLGQITLRVRDIDASLCFYRDGLGMRLLSIQPVRPHGFTLYFLAFSDETPPRPELTAVHNREWLWRRPYTTLELLHRDAGVDRPYALHDERASGFDGIEVACGDAAARDAVVDALARAGHAIERDAATAIARDPDGARVILG